MQAETTTTGLWDAERQMVLTEELPLSSATCTRLEAWCVWFYEFEGYLPPSHRTPPVFPLDAFNAEGRAIAALIQNELPDWTVVYEDEPLSWSAKQVEKK
jgi:hypothetical protein